VQEHQPPSRPADDRFIKASSGLEALFQAMCTASLGCLSTGACKQFSDLSPSFVATHNHDRFAGVVVHGVHAVMRVGLSRFLIITC